MKVYFMRVVNVYPDYKDALEREKSVQDTYTELQLIFYNKERGDKKKTALFLTMGRSLILRRKGIN